MVKQDNRILALLGFNCTGDMGPWTLYTSARHQIVFYPRVPALNPPSPKQTAQRTKWHAAATAWSMQPAPTRARFELAARRASLRMTGYNLWISVYTRSNWDDLATLSRQTGVPLP